MPVERDSVAAGLPVAADSYPAKRHPPRLTMGAIRATANTVAVAMPGTVRTAGDGTGAVEGGAGGQAGQAFSIVHSSGCWFMREYSLTCATLVSATSRL